MSESVTQPRSALILASLIVDLNMCTALDALPVLRAGVSSLEAALLEERAKYDAALGLTTKVRPAKTDSSPAVTDPKDIDGLVSATLSVASSPRSIREIGESTNLSEKKVKDSLVRLASASVVRAVDAGRGSRYMLADRATAAT